jgi:hypothetical protein
MSRVPFDIQFLIESILSEDPDGMSIRRNDAELLKSKGADVEESHLDWDKSGDAVPFYIDKEADVVVFARAAMPALENKLPTLSEILKKSKRS